MAKILRVMFDFDVFEGTFSTVNQIYVFERLCKSMNITFNDKNFESLAKDLQFKINAEDIIMEPQHKQLVMRPFVEILRLRNEGQLGEALKFYEQEYESRVQLLGEYGQELPNILRSKANILALNEKQNN